MKFNRGISVSLSLLAILILSACFAEKDLESPIKDFLLEEYGIKSDLKILSTRHNWLKGQGPKAYVEIDNPYQTILFLSMESKSLKVNKYGSDAVFLEVFKAAYVEQHKDVFVQSRKIIKKYNLLNGSPHDEGKKEWYYLQVNIEEQQEKELLQQFKITQKIDTVHIVPVLKMSKPRDNFGHVGVVNLIYQFDINQNKEEVPKAQNIMDDFQRSRVLKEGIYNIAVNTINVFDNGGYAQGIDKNNTNVLFKVESSGKFTMIPEN